MYHRSKRPKLTIFCVFLFCSCNKIVSIRPPATEIVNSTAFSTDASAISALEGLYSTFISTSNYDYLPTLLPSLSSDELVNFSSTVSFTGYANDNIQVSDPFDETVWQTSYNLIYQSNSLLENVLNNNSLSDTVKSQIEGESLCFRALIYFELTNFYSSVPVLTTTDVSINSVAGKSTPASIYAQIISDLTQALGILSDSYPSANRARINRSSAAALLARVYLYQRNWDSAVILASQVINDPLYTLNPNLSSVFISSSPETILQFATPNGFTDIGQQIIPTGTSPNFAFTTDFVNSIEPGDQRAMYWMNEISTNGVTYYYPFKYKQFNATTTNIEYLVILRLAEQYLIRAEAAAQQNNMSQSLSDLNLIRTRSGLLPLHLSTKDSVLSAIANERRMELFTEFGHRWFDLKRTGAVSNIISAIKPNTWVATDSLYPIPVAEILANPNLQQNPGY